MAKGQQRSNREKKKPKASKVAAANAAQTAQMKGSLSPLSLPKKKG
jgi:hypothetical protein